jgi:hypothetical protein
MKNQRTIASKINSDILIRLMISLSAITQITKQHNSHAPSNKNELNDDLDVPISMYQIGKNKDMTTNNTKSEKPYNAS